MRRLPTGLASTKKVVFDLSLRNDPELTFLPMAGKRWSPEVVPEERLALYRKMIDVDASTPPLAPDAAASFRSVGVPSPRAEPYVALTAGAAGDVPTRLALQRSIGSYQQILRFAVENLDGSNAAWDWFSRDRLGEYVRREAASFSTSGVDVSAMGRVGAGLLAAMQLGLLPRVREVRAFAEILRSST